MRGMANGSTFQHVSTLCVVANTIMLLSDHAEPHPQWLAATRLLDIVFFVQLCFEVVINLLAYGVGGFLSDWWKIFDGVVALISCLGFLFTGASTVAVFVRSARAFRIIRLMRMIQKLRVILETMVSSMPQMLNIIGLFCLFLVMFAAIFMQLFATTKYLIVVCTLARERCESVCISS